MTLLQIKKKIIGLSPEKARELISPHKVRVIMEDGKSKMGDCRAVADRVNVEVTKGIITKVVRLG